MGKGKKGKGGGGGGGGGGGSGSGSGSGGGVGGGGEGGGGGEVEVKKENENAEKHLNIVMKIDLHCDGCTKRIRKQIAKFPGVLKVEFEGESKVKIMAEKNVDAVKLREKLQNKTLKKVELTSPQPPKKDDKKNGNKNENPKEAPVTTVMLKVAYHCHGCGERLYKAVTSYKGVHEVVIDKEKERVKVTGRMDVKKMVEDLKKKLNKPVEVANESKQDKEKPKENNEKEKEKKVENNGGGNGKENGKKEVKVEYLVNGSGYIGVCDGSGRVLEIFDTPQLFSDDNPNACSVM